jgi:sulfur carrier protein ThiS
MQITVNLAGAFGGRVFNESQTLEFPAPPTILDVFSGLNSRNGTDYFSKRPVDRGLMVVMHNGVRVPTNHFKRLRLEPGDTITLLQPVMGG